VDLDSLVHSLVRRRSVAMWRLRNSYRKNVLSKDFFGCGRQSAGNPPEPSNKQTPLMVQVQGPRGTLKPCC
jgi:hypothetical protein